MRCNTILLKGLRNKLFALTTTIFLVVIIGAFVAIYINTHRNIQQEIMTRLSAGVVSVSDFQDDDSVYLFDPLIVHIDLSKTGEIDSVHSLIDISSDILDELVNTASDWFFITIVESDDNNIIESDESTYNMSFSEETSVELNRDIPTTITVRDREWQFITATGTSTVTLGEDGNITFSGGISITFMDVTDFENTLSSLLYTLLVISLVLLPVVAFISYHFSNRAIKPLAEAWEKQKQFIADASHELRTPITIIKGNLDVVMSNPDETVGAQMEWLNYASIGAGRMSKLANDLLSLANAESPDLRVQKEVFNVSGAMTDLVNAMVARANEKGVEIISSIQPNISIHSDEEKIVQIATILIDNAIKYSEPNGSVKISLASANHHICLSVTNNGKGIKATELPNIFDRFYQTEPSRSSKNDGFGLGLSIARALTEKVGGKLLVTSGENGITTFDFAL